MSWRRRELIEPYSLDIRLLSTLGLQRCLPAGKVGNMWASINDWCNTELQVRTWALHSDGLSLNLAPTDLGCVTLGKFLYSWYFSFLTPKAAMIIESNSLDWRRYRERVYHPGCPACGRSSSALSLVPCSLSGPRAPLGACSVGDPLAWLPCFCDSNCFMALFSSISFSD